MAGDPRQPRWTSNRLILALRLLYILPVEPNLTLDDLARELDVPRDNVRRLLRDVELAGLALARRFRDPDGRKVFGIGQSGQALVRRLIE